MKEFVLIIAFISGGLTLLGFYIFIYSPRGAIKSELERANAIVVEADKYNAMSRLTYWINVYYLKLINNSKSILGLCGGVFIVALAILFFLGNR